MEHYNHLLLLLLPVSLYFSLLSLLVLLSSINCQEAQRRDLDKKLAPEKKK